MQFSLGYVSNPCSRGHVTYNWGSDTESGAGVCKLQPTDQIQPTVCFCMSCKLRIVFTFLNSRKKIRWWIFYKMWKLHEIQFSLSIDKVLLEHNYTHLFTYLLWMLAFMPQWQSWLVTVTGQQSLKHLLPGFLQRKFLISGLVWIRLARTQEQELKSLIN